MDDINRKFFPIFVVLVVLFCFGVFGMFMSFKQHSGWAAEREACRQAGGVPWQAKHSGGPICLEPSSIKAIKPSRAAIAAMQAGD